jgi:hypothetical protein
MVFDLLMLTGRKGGWGWRELLTTGFKGGWCWWELLLTGRKGSWCWRNGYMKVAVDKLIVARWLNWLGDEAITSDRLIVKMMIAKGCSVAELGLLMTAAVRMVMLGVRMAWS